MLLVEGVPSIFSLLRSKIVIAYIVVSALLGLASTYYFDDPANEKLTRILKVGLQIIGLAVIYFALIQHQLAICAIVVLLTWEYVIMPVSGWWRRRQCNLEQDPTLENNQLPDPVKRESAVELVKSQDAWGRKFDWRSEGISQRRGQKQSSGIHQGVEKRSSPTSGTLGVLNEFGLQAVANAVGSRKDCSPSTGSNFQEAANDEVDAVNPIVRKGLILNPLSGRTIHIGKQRYKELVEQGYWPNFKDGVLEEPLKREA